MIYCNICHQIILGLLNKVPDLLKTKYLIIFISVLYLRLVIMSRANWPLKKFSGYSHGSYIVCWVFNWELFGHCSVLIGLSCLISTLKGLWSRSLVTSLLVSVRDGPSFSFLEFGKYNFLVLWSTWLHPNGSAYILLILNTF